jgi:SAM-dependent methyltransferase
MPDVDARSLNLKVVYGDGFFSGDEYVDYLRDRWVFEKQFRERLQYMKKYQSGGDLVEIGCAYGFFLAIAQESYRVRGFDIAERPVAYARECLGVDARCEDFLDASLEPESVDTVVMWDTIEHLPRPDLIIDEIVRVLRPNGFLFLTTGDIGSVLARARRERWRLIRPPSHLHYFSRKTIARLLENGGLRPVEVEYVGVRRSLRQIVYSLLVLRKQRPSRLYYRLIADSPVGDLSFVLNTYDIMLVVAQKSQAI